MSKETIEVIAESLFPDSSIQKRIFIKGAELQAERMYSEEEVESIWKFALYSAEQHDKFGTKNKSDFIRKDVEEFIEQFKKKQDD